MAKALLGRTFSSASLLRVRSIERRFRALHGELDPHEINEERDHFLETGEFAEGTSPAVAEYVYKVLQERIYDKGLAERPIPQAAAKRVKQCTLEVVRQDFLFSLGIY